tara:strand:- start:1296 stop:1940 length:645 start_codon:yes stop_codon:yes gene_type:complete
MLEKKTEVLGIPFYRFYYTKSKIDKIKKIIESQPFTKNTKNYIWAYTKDEGMQKMLHDLPELKSFFGWVHECLQEVAKDLKLTVPLEVNSSWCNMNGKGDSFHGHTHPNAFVSSNYYVSGWKKDHTVWHLLNPYFGNNIFPLSQKDYSNEEYDLKHLEPTEPGKYIVFPPKIFHYAQPNTKDETRYTIAANAFPNGLISCGGTNELNLKLQSKK